MKTLEFCLAFRLENVQIFIGQDNDSYQLAAYHPGAIGPTWTVYPEHVFRGRWVMITRLTDIVESAALCEVEVIGHRINANGANTGNAYKVVLNK